MKAARAVEKSFAAARKTLPINVDGAISAILADLGMNPVAFNGIFMIARTPGLVAHVIEEQTREKPMRRIDPVNHGYDGPASRNILDKAPNTKSKPQSRQGGINEPKPPNIKTRYLFWRLKVWTFLGVWCLGFGICNYESHKATKPHLISLL